MPRVTGVVETALDVQDLAAAIEFYNGLLGLEIIDRNERFCALSVAGCDVFCSFSGKRHRKRSRSREAGFRLTAAAGRSTLRFRWNGASCRPGSASWPRGEWPSKAAFTGSVAERVFICATQMGTWSSWPRRASGRSIESRQECNVLGTTREIGRNIPAAGTVTLRSGPNRASWRWPLMRSRRRSAAPLASGSP
jgi:catechol 2,3-dioxygenase-like lactoylglutathione lyase family enzyme